MRWLLALYVVACKAPPSAVASDGPYDAPHGAPATAPSEAAAVEHDAAPQAVPSVTYDSSGDDWMRHGGAMPHRQGGLSVEPHIDLPWSNTPENNASFETLVNDANDFPVLPFRTRGLPAISEDGTRIAYVFSPMTCCRFVYGDYKLLLLDAKTGAIVKALPLASANDAAQIPQQRDKGGDEAFHANAKRLADIVSRRQKDANAALTGSWRTIGSVDEDTSARYEGEGVHFTVTDDILTKLTPFDVEHDDGRKTRVPLASWKVPLAHCPTDRYSLTLREVWGVRDAFLLFEVSEDDGPDGCETSRLRFVSLVR